MDDFFESLRKDPIVGIVTKDGMYLTMRRSQAEKYKEKIEAEQAADDSGK